MLQEGQFNMQVLVLNASYEALSFVNWKRAVTLVFLGAAEIHEVEENKTVRSASVSMPMPKVIRLIKYVYVKYVKPKKQTVSKQRILARDNYTCIYCGKKADTVDHIIPKSRGGENSWENMAACCKKCNSRKGSKTPKEAGMKPAWKPEVSDVRIKTCINLNSLNNKLV